METTAITHFKAYCTWCGEHVYEPCATPNQSDACVQRFHKPQKPQQDSVVRPKHYTRWKIEPFRFFTENKIPFAVANPIKYLLRYDEKNGLEDLRKARRCIDLLMEIEYSHVEKD